jgi:hypothetical protein
MRNRNRNKSKRLNKSGAKSGAKGGAATVMPLQYYNPGAAPPSASAGRDLLGAIPPIGVRPKIGGKHKKMRKSRKTTGGFVPSIMDGFVAAASRFIVPVALFAGYKLLTRKQKKHK